MKLVSIFSLNRTRLRLKAEVACAKLQFLADEFQAGRSKETDLMHWMLQIQVLEDARSLPWISQVIDAYDILFHMFAKQHGIDRGSGMTHEK